MASMTATVRFEPSGRLGQGRVGDTLMAVALAAGVHVNASCGGSGTCGTCKVRVVEGAVEGGLHPKLSAEEARSGYRLACTAVVRGDCWVEVPLASEVDHSAAERGRTGRGGRALSPRELRSLVQGLRVEPAVFKAPLRLSPPTREDALSDLDRVLLGLKRQHGIHPVSADFRALRSLGTVLRASGWEITTTLVDLGDRYRLIQVEPADTSEQNYAIVVDIGTTTLAAQLLDLRECQVVDCEDDCPEDCNTLAATSRYNPQISYGEDVISRILQAVKPQGLEVLQKTVVDGINEMIERVLREAGWGATG